jgi:hypothetical protein
MVVFLPSAGSLETLSAYEKFLYGKLALSESPLVFLSPTTIVSLNSDLKWLLAVEVP